MLLTSVLIVVVFVLLTLLYFQNYILQLRHKQEIRQLKEIVRKLKHECEDANERASKYEDDFQKELTRVSVLLSKFT